jgi:Uma2 family endonuclease
MAARLSSGRYTYPDVVIACGEQRIARRGETGVPPRVVFEVLSESTERYDRGLKSSYYRQCQTLDEYVMVSTDYQSVEVFRRAAGEWGLFRAYRPGDVLELASVDVRFPIEEVYADTDVPETPPEGHGVIRDASPVYPER